MPQIFPENQGGEAYKGSGKKSEEGKTIRWDFVYLHGKAEDAVDFDVFTSDQEKPGEGVHDCLIGEKEAKVYIWTPKDMEFTVGLVVLADDVKANAEAKDKMANRKPV